MARSARAWTQASFISSLMAVAPTSSAPRKMNGKQSRLLTWFGIVGAAGGHDDVRTGRPGDVGHDLRHRVGQRQDDRLRRHCRHHLGRQHAGCRKAQEDVGARNDLGQGPGRRRRCVEGLLRRHLLAAAGVDDALVVDENDVVAPRTHRHQQVEAGDSGRAAPGRDDADVFDALADAAQRVQHRGADDDGSAVLIVVQHRDFHPGAQPFLDDEALGRLDVLEVDGAEGGLEHGDSVGQLLRIVLVHLDVEDVDVGELLEENGLALHHRLCRKRSDVAEAEDGGAVGDHRDEVAARGEPADGGGVGSDGEAGLGHARRVGQRQIVLGGERLGGRDAEFSRPRELVVVERLAHRFLRRIGSRALPRSTCRSAPR